MKKALAFLKSMRFGLLLLVAVMAFSFAGSFIAQQREPMEYVRRYGEGAAKLILATGLNDVFGAWYFIALLAALCVNLTLCSVARIPRSRGAMARLQQRAADMQATRPLPPGAAERVRDYLRKRHYRERAGEGYTLFWRGGAGFYGSALTHVSILLVLGVGSAALLLADTRDYTVMPGSSLTLDDGITLSVERFQIEDDTGRLDYASLVRMAAPDGSSAEKEIRVNEPLRFGAYKVYQQTYGTAGGVRVTNNASGASEDFTLSDPCFLTLDGRSGLYYQALYSGYITNEDGGITLITSTSGAYVDPVYDVRSVSEGVTTAVLAFPGETLTIGDVSYTMLAPISYPGLRVKHVSGAVLGALYGVFALMVAALYLCFFVTPVCVRVEDGACAIASPKPTDALDIALDELLSPPTSPTEERTNQP